LASFSLNTGAAAVTGGLTVSGGGTALTVTGTATFNNNIQVVAQIHQLGGSGSGGIRSENRLSGVVCQIPTTGANGTGPVNRTDGDMWTTTNRLYIRLNGNDYLVMDGSSPLGTISNNSTVL
jgi:hypothetical protein